MGPPGGNVRIGRTVLVLLALTRPLWFCLAQAKPTVFVPAGGGAHEVIGPLTKVTLPSQSSAGCAEVQYPAVQRPTPSLKVQDEPAI